MASGSIWEASGRHLGEASGGIWEASWGASGSIWESFWVHPGTSGSIWKRMETSGRPLEASVKHLEASGRHLGCWTVPRRKPPEDWTRPGRRGGHWIPEESVASQSKILSSLLCSQQDMDRHCVRPIDTIHIIMPPIP